MRRRPLSLSALALLASLPSLAAAGVLVSAPLSHPAGFQKVECHVVNAGTKDLVVQRFFMDDVNSPFTLGSAQAGLCTGSGPWTVPPGSGCSRSLNFPGACNQPNACFCLVEFSGSAKNIRGNIVATVNASTVTLTEPLR